MDTEDTDDSGSPRLWRISAFQRARAAGEIGPQPGDDGPALLPTTLLAELHQLRKDHVLDDVLEVIAACVRNREAALLYLEHGSHVWPVTVFAREQLYHSPRSIDSMAGSALLKLRVIGTDPPGVRPPDSVMQERVSSLDRYRPLSELAWGLALRGPRTTVLGEIGGRAAYRVAPSGPGELPRSLGALTSAVARLQQDAASLRDIAGWPGLNMERASRLINALYLSGSLMVSRTHPAARGEPAGWRRLFGRR